MHLHKTQTDITSFPFQRKVGRYEDIFLQMSLHLLLEHATKIPSELELDYNNTALGIPQTNCKINPSCANALIFTEYSK